MTMQKRGIAMRPSDCSRCHQQCCVCTAIAAATVAFTALGRGPFLSIAAVSSGPLEVAVAWTQVAEQCHLHQLHLHCIHHLAHKLAAKRDEAPAPRCGNCGNHHCPSCGRAAYSYYGATVTGPDPAAKRRRTEEAVKDAAPLKASAASCAPQPVVSQEASGTLLFLSPPLRIPVRTLQFLLSVFLLQAACSSGAALAFLLGKLWHAHMASLSQLNSTRACRA